ncbi:MAG: alkaline phosphatase family protein [Propionibacteriaceae bacterium]|nr:alkaline phosphatase family protein [Propionibacteriaceae bacterium]
MGAETPLVPDYGRSTLADVFGSVATSLGVDGWPDPLSLPASRRWVILLIDGLGDANLAAADDCAPYLSELRAAQGRTITSAAPSTTATSITSLGTGLPPGEHGIVGYSFRNPVSGGLLNALAWERELSALDVQPRLTGFERLARSGIDLTNVGLARFQGTGLTECALRGARFRPVPQEEDHASRIEQVVDAAASGEASLVYFYERELDHTGHGEGWQSSTWRHALRRVDNLARRLRDRLPDDVSLLITGDHGMVDSPRESWLIAEDVPGLLDDVTLLAGEGRFRQLYAEPGRVGDVARRWASALGERAWVVTRDEAIAGGWFGPNVGRNAERIGDVLVLLRDDGAVMTRSQPKEFGLVGMHGSLTDAEMRVPLLVG